MRRPVNGQPDLALGSLGLDGHIEFMTQGGSTGQRLYGDLQIEGTVLWLRSLHIEPVDPAYLTDEHLRGLRITTVLDEATTRITSRPRFTADDTDPLREKIVSHLNALAERLVAAPRARGRPPVEESKIIGAALRFLAYVEDGSAIGAIKRVSEDLSVSEPTVRRWLKRAEELGWITGREVGKPGARRGPKLLAELELIASAAQDHPIAVVLAGNSTTTRRDQP